jgi:carbonic anhydrase/acetyltransferase-like protein (isoleucine patch superfamily)
MRAAAQRAAALLLAQPGALRGEAGAAAARGFSAWAGPTELKDISEEWYLRQRRSMPLGNRIPHAAADSWIAPNAVVVGDVDLLDRVRGGVRAMPCWRASTRRRRWGPAEPPARSAQVSVWYGAVLRGDLNNITIGSVSNIQDRTVIHAARCGSGAARVPLPGLGAAAGRWRRGPQQPPAAPPTSLAAPPRPRRTSPTGLTAATLVGKYVTVEPQCVLRSCRVEDNCIVGAKSVLCEGSMMEPYSMLAPGSVLPPARRVPEGELWAGSPATFVRKLTKDEVRRVWEGGGGGAGRAAGRRPGRGAAQPCLAAAGRVRGRPGLPARPARSEVWRGHCSGAGCEPRLPSRSASCGAGGAAARSRRAFAAFGGSAGVAARLTARPAPARARRGRRRWRSRTRSRSWRGTTWASSCRTAPPGGRWRPGARSR